MKSAQIVDPARSTVVVAALNRLHAVDVSSGGPPYNAAMFSDFSDSTILTCEWCGREIEYPRLPCPSLTRPGQDLLVIEGDDDICKREIQSRNRST